MSIRGDQNSRNIYFLHIIVLLFIYRVFRDIFKYSRTVFIFLFIIRILICCYIPNRSLDSKEFKYNYCITIVFSRINYMCIFVGVRIQDMYIFLANYCIINDLQRIL